MVEPEAGRHFTRATPDRSAAQFARVLRRVVGAYPAARTGVGHHNVFGLTSNPKAGFLEGAHRIQVVNTRKLGHALRDFDFADERAL